MVVHALPLSDMIFSATFKVYSTVSARRFMCDLRDAHGKGFIAKTPHYNSIFNYLENSGTDSDSQNSNHPKQFAFTERRN